MWGFGAVIPGAGQHHSTFEAFELLAEHVSS